MFDFLGGLGGIFGGIGYPMSPLREGCCSMCTTPIACQQIGQCGFQTQSARNLQAAMYRACHAQRASYDVDLPADAVREVKPTRALPAPLIEGDGDGGECD